MNEEKVCVVAPDLNGRLLLSAAETAEALGLSERMVWKLKDAGKMPQPRRIGSCMRWSVEDLRAWVADGCPAIAKHAA